MAADNAKEPQAEENLKEKQVVGEKEFAWEKFKAMLPGGTLSTGGNVPGFKWYYEDDIQETKGFLKDPGFKTQIYTTKLRLQLLKSLLQNSSSLEDAKIQATENAKNARNVLQKNLSGVSETIREMEARYRSFAIFIENAQVSATDKVNVTVFNANQSDLFEPDSDSMKKLSGIIQDSNEYSDYKKDAYGLMVIPGHHYQKSQLNQLASLLKNNRVHLITDALAGNSSLKEAEDYLDMLKMDQFSSIPDTSEEKAHMIVTVNEVVARDKEDYEKKELTLPASVCLAGLLYRTDEVEGPHVTPAGEIKGEVKGASRVKTHFNAKDHGTMSRQLHLVPLASPRGAPQFMGARTLCEAEELKFFAVARVYDMICNVMNDYAKGVEFRNFDRKIQMKLEHGIKKFLLNLKGNGRPLKNFGEVKAYEDTSSGEAGVVKIEFSLEFNMPIEKILFNLPIKCGGVLD